MILQSFLLLWYFIGVILFFIYFHNNAINLNSFVSFLKWLLGASAVELFGYNIYLYREYRKFRNIAAKANKSIEENNYSYLCDVIDIYKENREKHKEINKLYDPHRGNVIEFLTYYIDLCKFINIGEWQSARKILDDIDKCSIKIIKKRKNSRFSSSLNEVINAYNINKMAILFYSEGKNLNNSIINESLRDDTKSFLDMEASCKKSLIELLLIFNKILEDREKIKKDYYSNNIYDIYNRFIYDTVVIGILGVVKGYGVVISNKNVLIPLYKLIEKYKFNSSEMLKKLDDENKFVVNLKSLATKIFNYYFPNIDYEKNIKEICDLEPEYMDRVKTPKIFFEFNALLTTKNDNFNLEYYKDIKRTLSEIKEHSPYQYNLILYNMAAFLLNSCLISEQKTRDYFFQLISEIHFDKVTENFMWQHHCYIKALSNALFHGDIMGMSQLIKNSKNYDTIVELIENLLVIYANRDDFDNFNKLKLDLENTYEKKGILIPDYDFDASKNKGIYVRYHYLIYSAASISFIEFRINPWAKSFI